jgi:CheY-like chemotaxis protein
VSIAYDGVSGHQAALADRPDCVILDSWMPGMDGYTLARRLRASPGLEGVKLVSLSAFSDAGHRKKAAEAGFDHILTKPADLSELEALLMTFESIRQLAEKTEGLARRNLEIAGQTKELLDGFKENIKEVKDGHSALVSETKEALEEVKQDIKEVKADVKELKEEIKQVANKVEGQNE